METMLTDEYSDVLILIHKGRRLSLQLPVPRMHRIWTAAVRRRFGWGTESCRWYHPGWLVNDVDTGARWSCCGSADGSSPGCDQTTHVVYAQPVVARLSSPDITAADAANVAEPTPSDAANAEPPSPVEPEYEAVEGLRSRSTNPMYEPVADAQADGANQYGEFDPDAP